MRACQTNIARFVYVVCRFVKIKDIFSGLQKHCFTQTNSNGEVEIRKSRFRVQTENLNFLYWNSKYWTFSHYYQN